MSYLFTIDEKNNAIICEDAYKLAPELRDLTEKEMLYVILAYDYSSIYKQLPERDRIRRAMIHVFGDIKKDLETNRKILTAIIRYKGLQYDPKLELANNCQKKIESFMAQMNEENASPTQVKNILAAISELRSQIRDLETEVASKAIEKGKIRGDKTISYLETLMSNEKLYKSVIAPKK